MYDIRDGNSYVIGKWPDGNVWTAQNLRLRDSGSIIKLTPSDSDVSADFELPAAQTSGNTSWGSAEKHVYATGNTNYGNYYNWYTATASTGTSDMTSPSAANLVNASSSICPKGWRLPDGGQSPAGSFYALDIVLGGNGTSRVDAAQRDKFLATPYQYLYSGYYEDGLLTHAGNWWSRSAATTAGRAYNFGLNDNNNVYVQGSSPVRNGLTVRCINK